MSGREAWNFGYECFIPVWLMLIGLMLKNGIQMHRKDRIFLRLMNLEMSWMDILMQKFLTRKKIIGHQSMLKEKMCWMLVESPQ